MQYLNSMRKFNFVLILLLVLISFSGCSQISYGISVNTDGSVTEMVQVKLDNEALLSAGMDTFGLLDEIETVMQDWLDTKVNGRILLGLTPSIQKDNGNFSVTFSLNYSSMEAYYQFWEITQEVQETEYEFHFFYDREILSRRTTVFNDIQNSSFALYFQNWCEENYADSSSIWTDSDFQFGYVYALPSYLKYLSNADWTYSINGMSYYIWEFDLSQTDTQICFYLNVVQGRNFACWWLMFLVMTVIFGICLYMRMFLRLK